MKYYLKTFFAFTGIFIAITTLYIGGTYLSLQFNRWYGTMSESIETDIYRENKSYVEGTIRDLRELQVAYSQADQSQKESLRSLILHRSNELDWDRLPSDVKSFLETLKRS